MTNTRWFPARHELVDGTRLGRVLHRGPDWQIYWLSEENSVLIARDNLADRWVESHLLPDAVMGSLTFGGGKYRVMSSGPGQRLEPIAECSSPNTKADGLAFAVSLRETRKTGLHVPLDDAIYVERWSRFLPTWTLPEGSSDEEILGRWLTGGVMISAKSLDRLSSLLGWLGKQDVADLVEAAGFCIPQNSGVVRTTQKSRRQGSHSERSNVLSSEFSSRNECSITVSARQFQLPGRFTLKSFFNEHVIDIIENPEPYKTLGIDFPSPIILHGPPGCGKTFAVQKLVEYLDWPCFSINPNSVGSPYIHESSRMVGGVFDKATDTAPSVILIDEMEAYLSDRQIHEFTALHHIEVVAEFLRRIPEANRHQVLVIGMTNRFEMIDSAILRRGRFDHIVEVGMPSAAEVSELLKSLLAEMSNSNDVITDEIVQSLTGRALSDVAFVVREAARLAVRSGKSSPDTESLRGAVERLGPAKPMNRPMGFAQDLDHGTT